MYYLIEDGKLLKRYNTSVSAVSTVSADIKKEFDSEPVYNKKFLEPK